MQKGKIAILVASFAFMALVLYSLFHVQPVTVLAKHLEHKDGKVFVVGTVKNTSSRPTAIDIEVHYFTSGGRKLGQDTVSLDDLKAGQVEKFRTPPRDLPDVGEFSLYLNHGRDPYGN